MVLNRCLDRLVRLHITIGAIKRPAYQVCGAAGSLLACVVCFLLAAHLGRSLATLFMLAASSVAAFFAVAFGTKLIAGREALIYYHHSIAVLASAVLVLRIGRQPVLPYLDLTVIGLGLFLACGRAGCLLVGCCHGKPHGWGVRYGGEWADAGFTRYLTGVRLFPVQALESIWVFATVGLCSWMILSGSHPGSALASYIVVYSFGRFGLEILRGDPDRPYLLGLSEAQWTSVILPGGIVFLEWTGLLPFHIWHMLIALAIAALAAGLQGFQNLPGAIDIRELVQAIAEPRSAPHAVATSFGVRLSATMHGAQQRSCSHYAFSSRGMALNERRVRALARLVLHVRHPECHTAELVRSGGGVFHLIVTH